MKAESLQLEKQPLRVRHALLVYASPSALFRCVEDTGAYGWTLVTLLGLVVLTGYATVQTGLIDRTVDQNTEAWLAEQEKNQVDLIDRVELRDLVESAHKEAEFTKLITRLGVIVLTPMYMLASFLLIAAVLYAVVALTGRKPEYHTLMSIAVYAGFIELIALVLGLAMKVHYRTIAVDVTLRPLAPEDAPLVEAVLAAVDPFRFWFWVLIAIGLTVTRQLSRRMAIVSVLLMCFLTTAVRVGIEYGQTM